MVFIVGATIFGAILPLILPESRKEILSYKTKTKGAKVEFVVLYILYSLFLAMIGCLGGFCISCIATLCIDLSGGRVSYTEEYPLYAVKDHSYVTTRAGIGNAQTYSYILENEKGKHIESITSDDVYIIESDDTPSLVIHKSNVDPRYKCFMFAEPEPHIDYYTFTVPEGSVTYDYDIYLE